MNRITHRESYRWAGVLLFFVFLYGAACESTFEPLQENKQYAFSMYGTLDLHADTQWVRVMPIGESLISTDPEPNGTEVTLIRNDTGKPTMLYASLFRFGGSAYVWNYLTAEALHPTEEYTMIATAPDGRQSRATVTIPSVLPIPEVDYSVENEEGVITGTSADPLIIFEIRYLVQVFTEGGCAPETEVVISHVDDIFMGSDGEYRVLADNTGRIARALGVRAGAYIVNKRELLVISASEDWPDLSGLTKEEIVLPDVVSNVENGTGLVAGIASRRVVITPRQEPC